MQHNPGKKATLCFPAGHCNSWLCNSDKYTPDERPTNHKAQQPHLEQILPDRSSPPRPAGMT